MTKVVAPADKGWTASDEKLTFLFGLSDVATCTIIIITRGIDAYTTKGEHFAECGSMTGYELAGTAEKSGVVACGPWEG